MEDGGLSITAFDGFCEGDHAQFKIFVQADLKNCLNLTSNAHSIKGDAAGISLNFKLGNIS